MPRTDVQPRSNGAESKGSVGGRGSQTGDREGSALPGLQSPRGAALAESSSSNKQRCSTAQGQAVEPGAANISIRKPSFGGMKMSLSEFILG